MTTYKNLEELAIALLSESDSIRNSTDEDFYIIACQRINPSISSRNFLEVFKHREHYGLPNYASLIRARRIVKRNNEDLQPDKEMMNRKYKKYKSVREWVLNG